MRNALFVLSAIVCLLCVVPVYGTVFDRGETVVTGFVSAQSLCSGDMNNDGLPDLVAIGQSYTAWWENSGQIDGPWPEHTVCPGGSDPLSGAVDCGDLNNDGRIDLALALKRWNDVDWVQNLSDDGSTWSARNVLDTVYDGASCVCIGDITGDGHNDIVAGASYWKTLSYWGNNGSGSFSKYSLDYSEAGGHQGLALADLDANGCLDIIDARHEGVSLHLNQGGGTSWTYIERLSDLGSSPCATSGDFDGDGDLDVLAGGYSGEIVWYENDLGDASQWSEHIITTGFVATDLFAADFDCDNDCDYAVSGDGGIVWWENLGDGAGWSRHSLAMLAGASSVHAVDLSADGDWDLMATGAENGEIWVWENVSSVPEPSTWILLCIGGLVLVARGAWHKRLG